MGSNDTKGSNLERAQMRRDTRELIEEIEEFEEVHGHILTDDEQKFWAQALMMVKKLR